MGVESLPPTAFAAIGILLVANVLIYKFVLKRSEKKVEEFMTKSVVTVAPSATVMDASKIMDEKKISCVVVEKDGKPVGIITERDINGLFAKKACDESTPVDKVMSSPVEIAGVDSNVDYVVRKMIQKDIRRLPVVKGGKVVGILTESDIVRQLPDMIPRVRKTMGWDYVDPRVTREMEEWFEKNKGTSWEELDKQFPKWYSFLEDRNMVRDGEMKKVHGLVKKAFEERKAA